MSWRRVVQILGGFCIGVGVLSMCNNFSELAAGVMGPEIQSEAEASMPAFMQDSSKANAAALGHTAYRRYMVVQGALDGMMAMLLIAGGIGLVRLAPWGRRLALVCGGYALATGAVYVVMMNIYLMPEVMAQSAQAMPSGVGVVASLFMLLVLWAFPATLLTLLMLPGAKRAIADPGLRARPVSASAFEPTRHADVPAPLIKPDPAIASQSPVSDAASAQDAPPQAAPTAAQQTWRDDPWNDPEAT